MGDIPMPSTCPQCGTATKAGAKFCAKCGAALAAPTLQHPADEGPRPAAAPPVPPAPAVPPLVSAAALTEAAENVSSALSQTWQTVAGRVRDLLANTVDSEPAGPTGALPGDYVMGVKPVSGKDSNIGNVRQVNEDSFIALEFVKVQESRGVPVAFYVVADGMGGHRAGEIASRTVNKIIADRVFNAEVLPGLSSATRKLTDTPGGVLTAAIQTANQTLHRAAREQGSDMGTTITTALLIGDTATIANVGDSRTYLWRDGTLRQVTRDHSLVASLVEAGMLQPAEMREHPGRNQVLRSLGTKPDVTPDIFTETLQRGDRLILCSDGLWEKVLDADINRIVARARTPQDACRVLIQRAKDAGGEDNITVIVVKLE